MENNEVKNWYRTVVTTPLGVIYGEMLELNHQEYIEQLNFLKHSYSYESMRFATPKGDVIIPGDMLKKSFIILEKIDID
jgi:hypothetical protein